jgi:hypothetical protein
MRWALSLFLLPVVLGAACSSTDEPGETTGECGEALSYESFAGPFFLDWCTGCHSSALPEGQRQDAPLEINFDTLDDIRKHRDEIVTLSVHNKVMPPAGGPSDLERELLGKWFACGAPAQTNGFDPPPAPPPVEDPPPTGACATPLEPLPPAVLPRCSVETRDCVTQCGLDLPEDEADDCRDACQAADTTPPDSSLGTSLDCSGCVFHQLLACGEAHGCHDEVAGLMCCITDCQASGDPACLEAECTVHRRDHGLRLLRLLRQRRVREVRR